MCSEHNLLQVVVKPVNNRSENRCGGGVEGLLKFDFASADIHFVCKDINRSNPVRLNML